MLGHVIRQKISIKSVFAPKRPLSDGCESAIDGRLTRERVAMSQESLRQLLSSEVRVVNVGLIGFAQDLESSGAHVVHVAWSPPAVTNPRMADLLAKLGG